MTVLNVLQDQHPNVRAMGLRLLSLLLAGVLGAGMMMGNFKQGGVMAWDREKIEDPVKDPR